MTEPAATDTAATEASEGRDTTAAPSVVPPAQSPTPPSSRALSEPGTRGRLEIAENVVERVATIAAGEVRGVRRVGSTLEGVVGRQYPKASADVAGGHAKVRLEIAVAWPSPLAQTASAVRDRVRDQLESLVGLAVDQVDVTVASVIPASTTERRRVQ